MYYMLFNHIACLQVNNRSSLIPELVWRRVEGAMLEHQVAYCALAVGSGSDEVIARLTDPDGWGIWGWG